VNVPIAPEGHYFRIESQFSGADSYMLFLYRKAKPVTGMYNRLFNRKPKDELIAKEWIHLSLERDADPEKAVNDAYNRLMKEFKALYKMEQIRRELRNR
jgi:hypothetical protein